MPTDSAPITVLAVGGTGESFDADTRTEVTGMLESVTADLDERFVARWVGYPASYGPAPQRVGISYARSVEIGVSRLADAFAATEGPVVLIGYSQGAVVVRTFAHNLSARADPGLHRLCAFGFVADPHQPPGVVPGCDGWGVAGAGPSLPSTVPAWWVGTADDMICNAEPDSLIRDVADLTGAMEFHSPVAWLRHMWQTLRDNAFQNAARTSISPAQWRRDATRLRAAYWSARRYLPALIVWRSLVIRNPSGGRHTSYRSEPYRRSVTDPDTTGCQALARWLQVIATFDGYSRLESCETPR